MTRRIRPCEFLLLLGICLACGCAAAPPTAALPVPGAPILPAKPYTMWTFLGLDPLIQKKCDDVTHLQAKLATVNPLFAPAAKLKALDDPAQAASPNVAVANAAAAVQKKADIPATKAALAAVAEIGCSCDPATEVALLAGLDNCFPEVRMAAAEAVRTSIRLGSDCCESYGCCTPALSRRLYELGWGVNDRGCWLEPSGKVRLAARQAFRACGCPPLFAADPQTLPLSEERPAAEVLKAAQAN